MAATMGMRAPLWATAAAYAGAGRCCAGRPRWAAAAPLLSAAAPSRAASRGQRKKRPNRKPKLDVLLTQQLPSGVGGRGRLLSVSRGYARNYLIPKDLAVYATPVNRKLFDVKESVGWTAGEEAHREARVLVKALERRPLLLVRRPRPAFNLGVEDVRSALAGQLRLGVPAECIELQSPEGMAAFGEYEATVSVTPRLQAKLTIHVREEEPRKRDEMPAGSDP